MKKFFLVFSFLSFISIWRLAAQPEPYCENYPYILNISGFYPSCGGHMGKVCFEYSSASWDNDCDDIFVEIIYPTGAFDVDGSSLDGFEYSTSGSNSILTYHPQDIGDAIWSECFEGELNTANTVFTLRLYYGPAPGTTFFDTEFKVDDIVHIGTYGQTTTLSSLTGTDLLDANLSDGNPQRIAVDGTLLIDEEYWFTSEYPSADGRASDLIMLPNSSIQVKEGITLHTSWANIHECDYNWNGIDLLPSTMSVPTGGYLDFRDRTMLSGAIVGVDMRNNTTFEFVDSEIRKCGIGLGAFGSGYKNITFKGMNSPWGNSISFFEDCDEGIHFENTSKLDLSMNTGLPYLILKDMKNRAIYLESTNLYAMGLSIIDCKNGIWVEKPNKGVVLEGMQCGGNGGKGIGVFTNGTDNLRVTNSIFINWGTGISRRTNIINQYTQVENVNMYQCTNNIWASVLPSKADIRFNNLNAVSHNVSLSGIGSGNHNWNIGLNNAMRSGTTPPSNQPSITYINRNILLNNVRNASIYQNETDFTSPEYNIYITGGLNNKVYNNIMDAPYSTKNNLEISGTDATVFCNAMRGASTAMTVMNTCTGSNIEINDFTGAYGDYNLRYGSTTNQNASTHPQELTGNIFDTSTGAAKARHFAPAYIAVQSQYIVGKYRYDSGSYPENYQGESHYPYFSPTSILNPWFTKKSTGVDHYACLLGLTEQETLEKAAQADIDLLNIRIDTIFGEEVAFDTKLKLARHLEDLSELTTLTGTFDTWYDDSLSTTDFAKFIKFEKMYKNASTFIDAVVGQTDQLNLEIDSLGQILDSLGEELDSVVWWAMNTYTHTITIDSAITADFMATKMLMDEKLDTFSMLVAERQAVVDTILDDMLSMNNSVGTQTTTSGANLKTVNAFLLERLDPEFEGFSEEDSTDLAEIAVQCVGEGGEGVYIARALLAEHSLEYPEYEDECIEERSSLPHQEGMAALASSLMIAPSPADEAARVELPKGHDLNKLTLLDAYGRVVQVYSLSPKQTLLKLDTSRLAEGVYFLAPSNSKEGPLRFVVLH